MIFEEENRHSASFAKLFKDPKSNIQGQKQIHPFWKPNIFLFNFFELFSIFFSHFFAIVLWSKLKVYENKKYFKNFQY